SCARGETCGRTFIREVRWGGVRGLIYVGEPQNLAAFLTEADSLGMDFDWVITDANSYDPSLMDQAAAAADGTYVRTSINPFLTDEDAKGYPATEQYRELMK